MTGKDPLVAAKISSLSEDKASDYAWLAYLTGLQEILKILIAS